MPNNALLTLGLSPVEVMVKWVILSHLIYTPVIHYTTNSEVGNNNALLTFKLSTIEVMVRWAILSYLNYLRVICYRTNSEVGNNIACYLPSGYPL